MVMKSLDSVTFVSVKVNARGGLAKGREMRRNRKLTE